MKFYCNDNKLPRINVVANTALQEFDISNNLLSALNIRSNTALTYLNVSNNAEISMVDVKYNTALEVLIASGLAITDIDLTSNTSLKGAELFNINLTATKKLNKTGLGIVFLEKTPYSEGKMMSVAETRLAWSTERITTNARNNDDGMANMNTIKALNSDLSKYPAFKWCADYGTDWYLPALNELKVIYEKKSIINSVLSEYGYKQLQSSSGDYASSTEDDSRDYREAYFESSSWYQTYTSKSDESQIRAIFAF